MTAPKLERTRQSRQTSLTVTDWMELKTRAPYNAGNKMARFAIAEQSPGKQLLWYKKNLFDKERREGEDTLAFQLYMPWTRVVVQETLGSDWYTKIWSVGIDYGRYKLDDGPPSGYILPLPCVGPTWDVCSLPFNKHEPIERMAEDGLIGLWGSTFTLHHEPVACWANEFWNDFGVPPAPPYDYGVTPWEEIDGPIIEVLKRWQNTSLKEISTRDFGKRCYMPYDGTTCEE